MRVMRAPSNGDVFEALCLQAAADGRGEALFGPSLERVRAEGRPFVAVDTFPSVYLEFPLAGEPFVDVTFLYDELGPHTRIDSPVAGCHEQVLSWFARAAQEHPGIVCGFELDAREDVVPQAALYLQPRAHIELVRPFCVLVGEPERAGLYEDLARRMPQGWPLSFFGLFRGRSSSPLRACGYLSVAEKSACASDPAHLRDVFDVVGFVAYDDQMLAQARAVMEAAPAEVDFQFDVYPTGDLGPTFGIDVRFRPQRPKAMARVFGVGAGARVMDVLHACGVADERWRLVADASFAQALAVEREDGTQGELGLVLMPQWVKARWTGGVMQPVKVYHFANATWL